MVRRLTQPAMGLVGEVEVLALRKVARMGSDEVEKPRLGVGVTEAADRAKDARVGCS